MESETPIFTNFSQRLLRYFAKNLNVGFQVFKCLWFVFVYRQVTLRSPKEMNPIGLSRPISVTKRLENYVKLFVQHKFLCVNQLFDIISRVWAYKKKKHKYTVCFNILIIANLRRNQIPNFSFLALVVLELSLISYARKID